MPRKNSVPHYRCEIPLILLIAIAATFPLSGCANAQNAPVAATSSTNVVPGATGAQTAKSLLGANGFYADWYWVDMTKVSYFNSLDSKVPLTTDEQAWPTMDCRVSFIANNHIDAIKPNPAGVKEIGGVYHVSFRCNNPAVQLEGGSPAFKIVSHTYDAPTKRWAGDLEVPLGASNFYVNFRDTSGGIRNLRCIRPGYAANTTQFFTDDFKKLMAPFSLWRPLSDQGHGVPQYPQMLEWNERDLPSLLSVQGIKTSYWPWEWQIQMANFLDCDLWINVPINASDDYVRKLAALVRDGDTVAGVKYSGLKPNLNVYVEYSNEVWNSGFEQHFWNYRAARDEINRGNSASPLGAPGINNDGTDNTANGIRHYAERAAQISQLFRQAWGEAMVNTTVNARVRPVLMWTGASEDQLNYIERWFGPVKDNFYAIGAAPYYGPEHTNGTTVDQLFESVDSPNPLRGRNLSPAWFHANALRQNRTLATFYGAHYAAYEFGFDAGSDENGTFTQARYDMNYDPRIGATQQNFLNTWYADGGEMLVYSSLYGIYFRWGTFPLTENPVELNAMPKYQALAAVAARPRPPVTAGIAVSATAPTIINTANYDIYPEGRTYPQTDGNGGTYVNMGRNAPTYRTMLLNVAAAGNYSITINASASAGTLAQLAVDGQPLANLDVPTAPVPPAGKEWATTMPVVVHLNAGLHALRFAAINNPSVQWYYGNISIAPGGTPDTKSKPAVPLALQSLAQNRQNLLFWQPAASGAGAATYTIYRGLKAGGEDAKTLKTGVAKPSFVDTSLANGTTYYYKVTAVNPNGVSEMSNETFATPLPRPGMVSGTQVVATDGKVTLSFQAPAGVVTNYNIYRAEKPGEVLKSPYSYATMSATTGSKGDWNGTIKAPLWTGVLDAATGNFTFTDNVPNKIASYRIAAVNGAGEGPISEEIH